MITTTVTSADQTLRDAMTRLLTDENQRGRSGQEAVRRTCAPTQIISQYQAVYEQVLKL